MNLLTGLILVALISAPPGQPPANDPELHFQRQFQQREQLHQQLRLLLHSPDVDVQRVGLAFHVLGKFAPEDLVPLLRGGLEKATRDSLTLYPQFSEPLQDALIAALADENIRGREELVKLLDRKAPSWRERPGVQPVVERLITQLGDEEFDKSWPAKEVLELLPEQVNPRMERLLSLAEEKPHQYAAGVVSLVPWKNPGEYRNRAIRIVLQRMRHRTYVNEGGGSLWMLEHWSGPFTREELRQAILDLKVRRETGFFGNDRLPHKYHIDQLDRLHPGWRQHPAYRHVVQFLTRKTANHHYTIGTLVALKETDHPELRSLMLRWASAAEPREMRGFEWWMEKTVFPSLRFSGEQQNELETVPKGGMSTIRV